LHNYTFFVSDTPQSILPPLDDPCDEGLRIAQAAASQNLPIRLIGGVAVFLRSPSAKLPGLRRTYSDVDVMTLSSGRKKTVAFFEEMGYVPDKMFNAIHGATRLNFMDPTRNRPLDVLLDRFQMCHNIDFRQRLNVDPLTVPLADLLLSKLQVVQLNLKDNQDIVALLADHALGDGKNDTIETGRLVSLLGADWGFEHTVRLNLEVVRNSLATFDLPSGVADLISERIGQIVTALDRGKKTIGWKSRAVVGERVRWYELPEDVRH
jgi:hypothetical protein